ncbi:MAG: hypothetical protein Q8N51_02955, partial [Gammaproteobacteria bacterium]|nr:hypothetical protein [Gammaproteobacteria bacterium]
VMVAGVAGTVRANSSIEDVVQADLDGRPISVSVFDFGAIPGGWVAVLAIAWSAVVPTLPYLAGTVWLPRLGQRPVLERRQTLSGRARYWGAVPMRT